MGQYLGLVFFCSMLTKNFDNGDVTILVCISALDKRTQSQSLFFCYIS
jgi:hypothetical protein